MSLFKLRNTWPQYFPTAFLHQLDLTVRELDPNWPVVEIAPSSGSIHINPKFLVKVCLLLSKYTHCLFHWLLMIIKEGVVEFLYSDSKITLGLRSERIMYQFYSLQC